MTGSQAVSACSPLPRPVWTPTPVLADAHGDAFEVAAAVLGLGDGVAVFPGAEPTPNARRRTFTDASRLAEYRRQRPDTVFSLRLGDGGGGVVALEVPATPDAVFGLAELASDLGTLPLTVTMVEAARRWHLFRLPQGVTTPTGKVLLGVDGVLVRGNGQSLPMRPSFNAWAQGAAPGETPIANMPAAWAAMARPNGRSVSTVLV